MLKITGLFVLVLLLLVLVVTATGQLHLLHESSLLGLVLMWTLYLVFLLGKQHRFAAINSLLLFILFALAEMLNFVQTEPRTLLSYSLLSIGLSLAVIVVHEHIKIRHLLFIPYLLLAAVYLIPLGFIIYYLQFDTRLSTDAIDAIMQTNIREALDFLVEYVSAGWILLVAVVILGLSYFLYAQEKTETEQITPSLAIFLVLAFLSIAHANRSDLQLYRLTALGVGPEYIPDLFFKDLKVDAGTGL